MSKTHECNIDNFIEQIKNFNPQKLKRGKYIFNPWTTSDDSDIKNAHIIRCDNLRNYLLNIEKPEYILIAESPSKGARYTGIAMTSEKNIKEHNLPFQYTSKNYKKYKRGESTATKVWKVINEIRNYPDFWKTIVFWNAFAFNIHIQENKWFETPFPEELEANKPILESFIKIYPKATIITVGEKAKEALKNLKITNIKCVRHPSNDYTKKGEGKTFPEQINNILK